MDLFLEFLPLILYLICLVSVSFWYDFLLRAYYDYKLKRK